MTLPFCDPRHAHSHEKMSHPARERRKSSVPATMAKHEPRRGIGNDVGSRTSRQMTARGDCGRISSRAFGRTFDVGFLFHGMFAFGSVFVCTTRGRRKTGSLFFFRVPVFVDTRFSALALLRGTFCDAGSGSERIYRGLPLRLCRVSSVCTDATESNNRKQKRKKDTERRQNVSQRYTESKKCTSG